MKSSTRLLVGALLVAALTIGANVDDARADRVHTLSRTLVHSKQDKARIAAAVSLGRLNDKRALKPLVHALRDTNRIVRAVAASGLGHLGDSDALPALQRARGDKDRTVRMRVNEAIAAIRNKSIASHNERSAARSVNTPAKRSAGFGKNPRRLGPEPTMYLVLKSTNDESKGVGKKARKRHKQKMRTWMLRELQRRHDVTMSAGEAATLGLDRRSIDVSITRLDRNLRGKYMEIECEIRIAISNDRGKMLSFLTGGAKVQVPAATFRRRYEAALRLEAIENAVKSVHQDLIKYLRRNAS